MRRLDHRHGAGGGRRGWITRCLWHAGRGGGASLQPYGILVAACLASLIPFTLPLTLQAQETNQPATNGSQPADLARQASTEYLPQVSAAVLRTKIQQEQDPERRLELSRRLVALLVAGGRNEEAIAVCSAASPEDSVLLYWKALALASSGDALSARPILEGLLSRDSVIPGVSHDQLLLSTARVLRMSGHSDESAGLLGQIPTDSPYAESAAIEKAAGLLAAGKTPEVLEALKSPALSGKEAKAAAAYLSALSVWRSGDVGDAAKLFESVPPATPWIASASVLGAAYCLSASGKDAKAMGILQRHLEVVDDAPFIDQEFRLLNQLSGQVKTPSPSVLFSKWAQDRKHPERAKYAAFYEALRRQREDARGGDPLLQSFVDSWPDDALSDEARLFLALSALRQGKQADAVTLAADRSSATAFLRARYAYVRGLAAASLGDQATAIAEFQKVGKLDSRLGSQALFNQAVLTASSAKGKLDLSEQAKEIAASDSGLPAEEMRFQIALDLARRSDPAGAGMLAGIVSSAKDPGIAARARLASAELSMKSGEVTTSADDAAKVLRDNDGEPERQEYLAVFLKDKGSKSDTSAVIAAARAFLAAHPDSKFVPEVRLKLAESLLTKGDLQGARVQFENLASTQTGTEFGRRALFLAAQSASRSMDPASIDDALLLLERVAANGPQDSLTWQARLQEGAIKNAQGLPKDALAIYDKILSSQGPDAEIRAAALMARGDTLHRLADEDPSRDREAVEAWKTLSSDPSASLRWRNQALCKQGMILQKLGDGDAALTAYYEAFKNPRDKENEQLWHDKAAFQAARLLEDRKQWNDAIALYRQIESEGGPRAEESTARLSKLKLDNFLWEN